MPSLLWRCPPRLQCLAAASHPWLRLCVGELLSPCSALCLCGLMGGRWGEPQGLQVPGRFCTSGSSGAYPHLRCSGLPPSPPGPRWQMAGVG